jgi:hypothetical protein
MSAIDERQVVSFKHQERASAPTKTRGWTGNTEGMDSVSVQIRSSASNVMVSTAAQTQRLRKMNY